MKKPYFSVEEPDATYVATPYHAFPSDRILRRRNSLSRTRPIKRSQTECLATNFVTTSPLYFLGRDVLGKVINAPGTLFTEKDLTDEQLKVIDKQVRFRLRSAKALTPISFILHPNDTITLGFGANTIYPALYGRRYAHSPIKDKMTTPLGQVESILGDYGIKIYRDGYEVFDTYDFNHGQGQYPGNYSLYAIGRRWAGEHGHKDTDDDKGKIKFSIKRNVNHW